MSSDSGQRALSLRLDALQREVREHTDRTDRHVQDLAGQVSQLTGGRTDKDPPPSWHWDDLPDDQRDPRWAELEEWVDTVLTRWHPTTTIRSCWRRHRPAVAAVTAAWIAWDGAHRSAGRRATDPAAWLRDWLPALQRQLDDALGPAGYDADTGPCTYCLRETP